MGWRTNASQKRKPTQVKRVACLGADPQIARRQLWWLTGQPVVVISVGLETVRSQLLQFDIQFFYRLPNFGYFFTGIRIIFMD